MTTPDGRRSRRPIILILIGLIVAGLVMGGVGAVAKASDSDGDGQLRGQVISRATDFAMAYNTYDVAELGDYQKRLRGLLTPKYNEQFVEVTNAIFSALKGKSQTSRDAKVLAVAIDTIDADSAVALVAVDASIANTDNPTAVQRHFRWKVSFTRTKGEWLVSNFESVASADATTSGATNGSGK